MAIEHRNPHLNALDEDFLYHLGLDTTMDLEAMFGDVKFVCMGGSAKRAESFAKKLANDLDLDIPKKDIGKVERGPWSKVSRVTSFVRKLIADLGFGVLEEKIQPLGKTERGSLFKVGPIISMSHGMGMPSMTIFLHEVTKLLEYAGAQNFEYIRIGTSGGVGVEPGTVIVTKEGINGRLKPEHEAVVLGSTRKYPTQLNLKVANDILAVRGDIRAQLGNTWGTDDFFEGQGRLDGALDPGYTDDDKMEFLVKAYDEADVRNIEMEATAFAAFCLRAGIPAALVCAALVNRLDGDQVTSTPEQLAEYSNNAQELIVRYLAEKLEERSMLNSELRRAA